MYNYLNVRTTIKHLYNHWEKNKSKVILNRSKQSLNNLLY